MIVKLKTTSRVNVFLVSMQHKHLCFGTREKWVKQQKF